jgi:hypothetical protein
MRSALSLSVAALIALSIALCVTKPAGAQSPVLDDLLSIEHDLNILCRSGAGNEQSTMKVCEIRDKVDQSLSMLGYCYGAQDQAGNQMQWHKCTKESSLPSFGDDH